MAAFPIGVRLSGVDMVKQEKVEGQGPDGI